MRVKRFLKSIAIFITTIMLVACGSGIEEKKEDVNEQVKSEDGIVTINLWSHFGGLEPVIEAFEKENPNIKVNLKIFSYEEYEMKYKKSLVEENGEADLFIIDSNQYGGFNSINGLEDLLNDKYNAKDYKKDFDKELWELGKSMDKERLLGIPIASAPIVTYYRADIMEKYGFPSDPKELAEFMKEKENWFKIGDTLLKDKKYIMQWVAEIIRISTSDMAYFDENLEYKRDTQEFTEAIEIAKVAHSKGFSPLTDIWSEEGKKLLKEDKIAMLYLGSWGARDLEALVPEQKGKWRVTSLPFGEYGWNNASLISMAANSKHKDEAWKFIEFYVFKYTDKGRLGSVSSYLPFRGNDHVLKMKNEFLGGQKEQKFYEDAMNNTSEYPVTALDEEAFKLWDRIFNLGVSEGKSAKEIVDDINKSMNKEFIKEKEILLKENN